MALVNYDNSDSELSDFAEENNDNPVAGIDADKVEPEYKMRVPKSAARTSNTVTMIPNLVTSKTKTGKILLSVPPLEELDSSTDESDTESGTVTKQRSKKAQLNNARQPAVGLLSLLPPTRAPLNRDGPKPALMVPHQLTVKRSAPGHLVKKIEIERSTSQTSNHKDALENGAESDSGEDAGTEEDTSGSFFSFFQPAPENELAVAEVRAAATTRVIQAMASMTGVNDTSQSEAEEQTTVLTTYKQHFSAPTVQTPTSSLCRIDPAVMRELEVPKKEVLADGDEVADDTQCWTEHTFVPGPERKRARLNQPGTRSIPVHDLLATSNQSIREVNQADLTAGADLELMKSVTADESQYRSHRASEEDDPGKLAHRKHQITWLAYQAQENEIDLEKRWAEARRNKASSRSKYGF